MRRVKTRNARPVDVVHECIDVVRRRRAIVEVVRVQRQKRRQLSLAACRHATDREVIKRRDRISLRPQAHTPGSVATVVVIEIELAVEPRLDVIPQRHHPDRVPLPGCRRLDARGRQLTPASVVVVEAEVVLECVGADHVILAVVEPEHDPPEASWRPESGLKFTETSTSVNGPAGATMTLNSFFVARCTSTFLPLGAPAISSTVHCPSTVDQPWTPLVSKSNFSSGTLPGIFSSSAASGSWGHGPLINAAPANVNLKIVRRVTFMTVRPITLAARRGCAASSQSS